MAVTMAVAGNDGAKCAVTTFEPSDHARVLMIGSLEFARTLQRKAAASSKKIL